MGGEEEKSIQDILYALVYSSGSWSSKKLNLYMHNRIKHINQSVREWAARIHLHL